MNAYAEGNELPPKSWLTCATIVLPAPRVITTVLECKPEALGSAAMDNATLWGYNKGGFPLGSLYPNPTPHLYTQRK